MVLKSPSEIVLSDSYKVSIANIRYLDDDKENYNPFDMKSNG